MISPTPPRKALCAIAALVLVAFIFFHSQPLSHNFKPQIPGVLQAKIASGAPAADRRADRLLKDVYNSTLGFEDILVVGLPTRTDRRDGITLQASLSDIKVKFIDGVFGTNIPNKAIPTSRDHDRLADPVLGTWRAHMNAIQEVVRRNLSTALILEDDVDWDVRLKHELHDFALSTRALTQPLAASPDTYADPTFPAPRPESPGVVPDLDFHELPATVAPTYSPYGDNWDMLWLGQCAMRFPEPHNPVIPKARVVRWDDETVPETRYLWSFTNPFQLIEDYPQHTRVVHHAQEGVCALGYAVSQHGAQRLLHEVALKDVSDAVDILMRFFCDGARGRRRHTCLTTQPGLFQHHRVAGPNRAASDIGDHGDGWREHGMTDMVRWSTRLNADAILDGATEFHDQYPNADVPS